ncbi:TauD/TfdA dioxygenase family protein [Streptomyces decoyicus]|uniref:TauD/TfdA dioxygenase family protein n=3 Tax=Streptomyces decoyicus TaxID=249567 RepID=UPI003641C1EB
MLVSQLLLSFVVLGGWLVAGLVWEPTSAGWGARVGLDLGAPLGAECAAALVELFRARHLLVFSGQDFSLEEQIRFMGYLGPVLHEEGSGIGFVSNVKEGAALGVSELSFHSDTGHCAVPLEAVSLFAEDVEGCVTSTRFANVAAAYGRLPVGLRSRVASLVCENAMPVSLDGRNVGVSVAEGMPRAEHPVVWRHPVSGEPGLMVNANQTTRIVGLEDAESRELLEELFSVMYAEDAVYEHSWRQGDVVVWHNLAVQHARGGLEGNGRRTLRRVALGEKGFWEQCPTLRYADFKNQQNTAEDKATA